MSPDVSVIVVSWNTRALLEACLKSVATTTTGLSVETIVVDNASTDDSTAMVRTRFPGVRVVDNDRNEGFARACNRGARVASGRHLLFLNSDAELLQDALGTMVALADGEPRCGAVGALVSFPDGRFQSSHTSFPTLARELLTLTGIGRLLFGAWYPSHGPETERGPRVVDWVNGACLLVRRTAFDEVGGFDDQFFMYAEEMDLCWRMHRHGWTVWYHPGARAVHVGGGSTAAARRVVYEFNLYRSRVRFLRKHRGRRVATLFLLQLGVFTAVKRAWHGTVRWISRGRHGRDVLPLHQVLRLFSDDG